jgi:single-strand DNA-binding protein
MTDSMCVTGLVATTPRHITTSEGLAITSFRLASSQRRYDRAQQAWVDGDTNWYTVSAFRSLGSNAAVSINKGDRIVVSGKLRIRDWENTDRSGTTVEIEADCLGHDLSWGTATFVRSHSSAEITEQSQDDWPETTQEPTPPKGKKQAA